MSIMSYILYTSVYCSVVSYLKCVVFEVFIIIIEQIVFFWYDCYRRWQGKENTAEISSLLFWETRYS